MTTYLNPLMSDARPLFIEDFAILGADKECTFTIKHELLSDRHVKIEKRPDHLLVKDLQTASGTFVNETKIREAEMKVGDILRLGPFEFQVCVQEEKNLCQLKSKNTFLESELQSINSMAPTSFSVLLLGPSGSGKDVVAQEIHRCSSRSKGPFVSMNCSTLSEALIESELFGHVKGSFTGALANRKGAFETARGGTLFLDEIGELPFSLQAKLLRALENNEIRPVGSDVSVKTDVRIIAATHQNLHQKIDLGQFRSDLFFRLNVIQLMLPALNQRMEDFDDLLMSFARSQKVRFSVAALTKLRKHSWPGNIRELKNAVSRAKALFPNEYISEQHIEAILDKPREKYGFENITPVNAGALTALKEMEKQLIVKRLHFFRGNQRRTAIDLGIPKSTLHDRLKFYNIDPKKFRS